LGDKSFCYGMEKKRMMYNRKKWVLFRNICRKMNCYLALTTIYSPRDQRYNMSVQYNIAFGYSSEILPVVR
jgi:hypothetical protein